MEDGHCNPYKIHRLKQPPAQITNMIYRVEKKVTSVVWARPRSLAMLLRILIASESCCTEDTFVHSGPSLQKKAFLIWHTLNSLYHILIHSKNKFGKILQQNLENTSQKSGSWMQNHFSQLCSLLGNCMPDSNWRSFGWQVRHSRLSEAHLIVRWLCKKFSQVKNLPIGTRKEMLWQGVKFYKKHVLWHVSKQCIF